MKKPSSKSSIHTRFVPGEEIDTALPWQFGSMSTGPLRGSRSPERVAADLLAQQQRLDETRAAGYDDGLRQGYERAAAEMRQQMDEFFAHQAKLTAERMALCAQHFEARWAEAEQDVARGVLELACALARQVLRRELRLDTRAVEPVVREAVAMLGTETKSAVVRLNPEDFGHLDTALQTAFAGVELVFRPDPSVESAGCVVEAGGMSVDGSVDKRWSRAVAALGLNLPWQEPEAPDA